MREKRGRSKEKGITGSKAPSKEGREKKKRKYSRPGCLVWAIKNLWKIDKWVVFFIFALVAPKVLLPLVNGYFPKELIDRLEAGADFG